MKFLLNIIFASIFLFLFSSCGNEIRHDGNNYVVKNSYDVKDGIIYYSKSSLPYNGTIVDTVQERIVEYEVVSGVKYGKYKLFNLKKELLLSGNVIDDKFEGRWFYYYPSGEIETIGYFTNDKVDKKWTWYYKDGSVKEEGFFEDGVRDGDWVLYKKDGKIKSKFLFRNGYIVYEYDANEIRTS